VFIISILLAASARSQPYKYSNLRSKRIPSNVAINVDSLSIVPRTFFIKGFDTPYYKIDEVSAFLNWKKNIGLIALMFYIAFSLIV
jgi:hypothetical protein